MEFNKTAKPADLVVSQFITMKELLEMTAFVRNFEAKYINKKRGGRRKTK